MRSFAPFMLSVISWYTGSTLPAQSVQDALRTGALPQRQLDLEVAQGRDRIDDVLQVAPINHHRAAAASRPGTPSRMAGRSGAIGVPCAVYSQPAGVMLRGQR